MCEKQTLKGVANIRKLNRSVRRYKMQQNAKYKSLRDKGHSDAECWDTINGKEEPICYNVAVKGYEMAKTAQ